MVMVGVALGALSLLLARSQVRYALLADALDAEVVAIEGRRMRIRWNIHGRTGEAEISPRAGDAPGGVVAVRVLAGDPPRVRRPSWGPPLLTIGLGLASLAALASTWVGT